MGFVILFRGLKTDFSIGWGEGGGEGGGFAIKPGFRPAASFPVPSPALLSHTLATQPHHLLWVSCLCGGVCVCVCVVRCTFPVADAVGNGPPAGGEHVIDMPQERKKVKVRPHFDPPPPIFFQIW